MSNEIVIPFSTKALDAAKLRAKEILGLAKEAAKTISDKFERRTFLSDARATAKATVVQAKERLQLQARSAGKKLGEATIRPQINRVAATVNEVREKGAAVVGAAAGFKSFGGGLSALAGLAGFGPVGATAAAVVAIVLPIIEKRMDIRERALARVGDLRADRAIRRANIGWRLANDAAFRRQIDIQTIDAFGRARAPQAGWHPRSSRLSGVQ